MSSLIRRIASRSPGQAEHEPGPAHERIDSNVLLPQVRAGLNLIEETLATLDRREQDLLTEASGLYEQLKATATELADVRQQKALASDSENRFQIAIQTLEQQHNGVQCLDHNDLSNDLSRPEAFVVQAKT